MASADWDGVERETVEKIRLLKVLVKQLEPGPLSDKICNDLVLPALAKLGAFNTSVQIHEERDDGEMDVELRNTTGAFPAPGADPPGQRRAHHHRPTP